jgi:hypothetical protein
MDETGLSIGMIQASCVIVDSQHRTQYQAQLGRQEWVSIVECICANGTTIAPLMIFKGKSLSTAWIPQHVPDGWRFLCNTRDWTSNIHGLEWLHHCFEPATHYKAEG